jgi:hypothetical protein
MRLPCSLDFPSVWSSSLHGFTANMHRDGALVCCDAGGAPLVLPPAGAKGTVTVELPPTSRFSQKCLLCEVTLVRASSPDSGEIQFAIRINYVSFRDL